MIRLTKKAIERINRGDPPRYMTTTNGIFLWVANRYDSYSSIKKCKILEDSVGRFWGYSDNPKIVEITKDEF